MAVVESFVGTDTADITSKTPTDGGSNAININGAIGISSNQGYDPSGGPDARVVWNRGVAGDLTLGVTVRVIGTIWGLVARVVDVNTEVSMLLVGSTDLVLQRRTGGSNTTIDQASGLSVAVNDVLTLEIVGNVYTMKQNGIARGTPTLETQGASATQHGIRNNGDTVARWNDFTFTQSIPSSASIAWIRA